MIRIQAARRVARQGAAGVAAIERFCKSKGANELSSELVRALGKVEPARALLKRFVEDEDFVWRPQALGALADLAKKGEYEYFMPYLEHGSWQMRKGAVKGFAKGLLAEYPNPDDTEKALVTRALAKLEAHDDADRRVAAEAAIQQFQAGDNSALPRLLEALDAEDVFFGDDLGYPARKQAFDVLRKRYRDLSKIGYRPRAARKERRVGIAKIAARLAAELPKGWRLEPAKRLPFFIFGYERRSCREGDYYLRVDRDGQVWTGAFAATKLADDNATRAWRTRVLALAKQVAPQKRRSFGRIRCDFDRWAGIGPRRVASLRAAPGASPEAVRELDDAIRAFVKQQTDKGSDEQRKD